MLLDISFELLDIKFEYRTTPMKNQRQGNKSTCFVWDLFPCL